MCLLRLVAAPSKARLPPFKIKLGVKNMLPNTVHLDCTLDVKMELLRLSHALFSIDVKISSLKPGFYPETNALTPMSRFIRVLHSSLRQTAVLGGVGKGRQTFEQTSKRDKLRFKSNTQPGKGKPTKPETERCASTLQKTSAFSARKKSLWSSRRETWAPEAPVARSVPGCPRGIVSSWCRSWGGLRCRPTHLLSLHSDAPTSGSA